MNAHVAARCGCVVILTPVPLSVAAKILRVFPANWIADGVLSEKLGAIVVGTEDNCMHARAELGLEPTEAPK